ncbi:MAG TPA: SDR family oxidoreductase [Candidatus Dormibacteraeota bacterium]|jgi:2-hydroxycyclohexanecarboxyl-CoA dehydrogenase
MTVMGEGRVALVTGGSGGVGAAICESLAEAGCRVAVADIDEAGAERVAARVGGLGVRLDVTSPEAVAAAVGRVRAELGTIGVCVNCAGWDELKPFLDTDEEFMRRIIDINLMGPMRVVRACLPGMIEMARGRVIAIASDAGRVGSSMEAVYSGAKGGVIAFTKTIAREMARHGITANTICPGPTDTPLLTGMLGEGTASARVLDAMVKSVPMRRLGRPEDIAPAVAFLASDHAGYITGQTLSVSGGLTMA